MIRPLLLSAVLMLVAEGCTNPPAPEFSPGDIPRSFTQKVPVNTPLWPAHDWWANYGDPQLNSLIQKAETGNLDIAQAAARLRQADARARQAGAALLPQVGAGGVVDTLYGQANGTNQHETDFNAGLDVSYELDFWGKNRDVLESTKAARAASLADRQTVALTVTSGVATTYFQLLSLRERISIAHANLNSSQDILHLVERRVTAGYSAPADLTQQRAAMAAEQAILPALQQQELETRNALAILIGVPPENFNVMGDNLANLSAPKVAPGLPSELLARRPDIATAEANLTSAHADLQAARAAFFPSISLTASGGVAYPALAAAVATLPGTGLALAGGANIVQTIFDGGRLEGRVEEAEARQEELLAAYHAAILASFSDVENALGSFSHLSAQEAALDAQAQQDEKVLQSARRKYAAGAADFLVVIDAQRTLFAARDQLADIRRARLAASVALFKAMGGGFDANAAPVR